MHFGTCHCWAAPVHFFSTIVSVALARCRVVLFSCEADEVIGMRLQVLGCGAAFGLGNRFQTCFHVSVGLASFLVDCGASS